MPGRGPGPGMGPGMGFGPMAMMLPSWAAPALFGGLALSALILALWKRRTLPPAESAIGMGCAATTLLLTGPWVQGDVAMRFYLNAMIPATITGLFVLVQIPNRWVCGVLGGVFVLLAVGPAVPLAARGGRPIISEAAFRELQSLAPRLANPQRTLVVTRHGVEWWSAWTLHTRVAQTKAVRAEDWQKYDEVYFLQSKERGGPGFGPPGGGMNRRPFPPDGFAGGPPPGDLPPFARNARGMGAGNRPPMMDSVIPEGAEVLHDGTFFKLAKVKQPPSFVRRNRTGETDDDRP